MALPTAATCGQRAQRGGPQTFPPPQEVGGAQAAVASGCADCAAGPVPFVDAFFSASGDASGVPASLGGTSCLKRLIIGWK